MDGAATFDFTGRTVFITGGATGIGSGIAAGFARAGADVIIGARRLDRLQAFCARFPERASYVQMDVGVADDRRRTIETVLERTGRLDVLVNNAISASAGRLENQSLEQIASMYDILLQAPTALIQLALPHLRASRGCVINISSVAARGVTYPPKGPAVYSAAKAGVNQLTRQLAAELGPEGVRINAIAPGPTDNDRPTFTDPAVRERFVAEIPLGRIASPDDIAGLALFLASDAAAWVTGQVVDASGGWYLTG